MTTLNEKRELTHKCYQAICSTGSFTVCIENTKKIIKTEELNKGSFFKLKSQIRIKSVCDNLLEFKELYYPLFHVALSKPYSHPGEFHSLYCKLKLADTVKAREKKK